jgi:hypothetical protein
MTEYIDNPAIFFSCALVFLLIVALIIRRNRRLYREAEENGTLDEHLERRT